MKYDILLCGVGGQGVISLANMISTAALYEGLNVRQSEVHGMAQRGGAVNAQVRISDKAIAGDLIPEGMADMILSMEAIEGLRYTQYLAPTGAFITAAEPMKNIATYPDLEKVYASVRALPKSKIVDTAAIAKKLNNPKAANIILLGAATSYLPLKLQTIQQVIRETFSRKGEQVVNANLSALQLGSE